MADAAPAYGRVERIAPGIRRVLAHNPSPFTYNGTGTYIVGDGEVAVIDPGPDDDAHLDALLTGLAGERVSVILVTHTHRDHSPLANALRARTGAPVRGCTPLVLSDSGPRADAGFDPDYAPDHVMVDGERVAGQDWTIMAVATPGHTSNHMCFAYEEQKALFTGDHVMGWATTVVSPPDGDMAAYLLSLEKLLLRDDAVYYPTHGAAVATPHRLVRGMIAHRRQRERQILASIADGRSVVPAIVQRLYGGIDARLHGAAGQSVLAHLIDLEQRGLVARSGDEWRCAA